MQENSYSYYYQRPSENHPDIALRLQKALYSLFGWATGNSTGHSNDYYPLTEETLKPARLAWHDLSHQFFDLLKIAFDDVPRNSSAWWMDSEIGKNTKFFKKPNPDFSKFLKTLPADIAGSISFLLDAARISGQKANRDTAENESYVELFDSHMKKINDFWPLTSVQFAHNEKVFVQITGNSNPEERIDNESEEPCAEASRELAIVRDTASSSQDRMENIVHLRDDLNTLLEKRGDFTKLLQSTEHIGRDSALTAKTFLYSQLAADFRKFDSTIFEAFYNDVLKSEPQNRATVIENAVHALYAPKKTFGLTALFSILGKKKTGDDDEDYDQDSIKEKAPAIAKDFTRLNDGTWADTKAAQLKEKLSALDQFIDETIQASGTLRLKTKNDGSRIITYTPDHEALRLKQIQTLLLETEQPSIDDQNYLEVLVDRRDSLPPKIEALGEDQYLHIDMKIVRKGIELKGVTPALVPELTKTSKDILAGRGLGLEIRRMNAPTPS